MSKIITDGKSSETIHVKKFGAKHGMSPSRMHQLYAWGDAKCGRCSNLAVVRALTYSPFVEMNRTADGVALLLKCARDNGGNVPMIDMKGHSGKYVKLGEYFACRACRREFERKLAHSPSWVHTHFDEMPADVRAQVQVQ